MRVLLTTESALPYLSGVTVSVDSLARGLGARGHEVLVLAPRPAEGKDPQPVGSPGPPPSYAWLPSYELPFLVPAGYRMPIPAPWAEGIRDALRFAPDVVHAHSPFTTGLVARRIARRVRAPLVFTHHTRFDAYGHYLGPLARPGAAATMAYLRRWWAGCVAVIAPSTDLAAEIGARMPAGRADRVRVIPTGVDVAAIRGAAPLDVRPVAGWPAGAVVVASLGRLAAEKDPAVVLDAFARAAALEETARLLVIGGGPLEAEVRARAAAPGLAGRVHVTGRLDRTDALARLVAADLFCFASRTETQGLVLAEALTAGLPAVAVAGPGVRDSVRDTVDGLVVPADPAHTRAARLGDALAELVADAPRRRAMATRARDDADRFAVERRVAETEELYRAVSR